MRHIRWGTCALAALLALTTFSTSPALARHGHTLPHTIDLPNGWQPEGITTDGKFVYSGSLANGAIFRANVRTGNGKVIAAGTTGRVAAGLDYDRRRDLLWVVGGPTGQIRAQDADTGTVLASYDFPTASPDGRFLNDVVVTRRAVFATDSFNQELAVIPLRSGGSRHLPAPSAATILPLTGDVAFVANEFNLNGIVESHHMLISVQSVTGLLFAIDERTGVSRTIDLHGTLLTGGDGLELDGRLLYVGRNQGEVDAIKLARSLATGRLVATITDPTFDVPTTVALARHSLFVINARFGITPTPDTPYWITRVDALH
jgi:outer membrane protein assembly factor BamB